MTHLYLIADSNGEAIEVLRNDSLIGCLNQPVHLYLGHGRGWQAVDSATGVFFSIVGYNDKEATVTNIALEADIMNGIKNYESNHFPLKYAETIFFFEPNFVKNHANQIPAAPLNKVKPGQDFCMLVDDHQSWAIVKIAFQNTTISSFNNSNIDALKKITGVK